MEQVITGRFDALNQAEGAAGKLRTIRASDVEISEWNGGSIREDEQTSDGSGTGTLNIGYGPNVSGLGGIIGGVAGISGGFASSGFGFSPYMGVDQYPQNTNQGYILNALIQDDQRDKAVRIIREAGGREF
jgi:hypothetical protein